MTQILGAKTGQLSIGDALAIAGTKIVTERLLATIVGNGSLVSGAVKLGGAMASKKLMSGKMGDILATAMTIDGSEDIVSSFFPTFSSGILGNESAKVEVI